MSDGHTVRDALNAVRYGSGSSSDYGCPPEFIHCECTIDAAKECVESPIVPTPDFKIDDLFWFEGITIKVIEGDGLYCRAWWDQNEYFLSKYM